MKTRTKNILLIALALTIIITAVILGYTYIAVGVATFLYIQTAIRLERKQNNTTHN